MQLHVQAAQRCLVYPHTFGTVQGANTGDALVFGNDTSKAVDLIAGGIRPKFGKNVLECCKRFGTHFVPPVLESLLQEI
jgi:hypothetical protein